MTSPMYGVGSGGNLVTVGKYDPKITAEIDRQIRNMPFVVKHCYEKAVELLNATGSGNFEIVLSTENGAVITQASSSGGTRRVVFGRSSKDPSSTHGPEVQRPRAYVMPANGKGIHEELSQGVLLKAALGMSGK